MILDCSGYMAPEYALHGQFSIKSDVYSFGVLVLEIISGRRNDIFHNPNAEDLISSVSYSDSTYLRLCSFGLSFGFYKFSSNRFSSV